MIVGSGHSDEQVWLKLHHQRRILTRFARRLGMSAQDAEDAVSDAIARIATLPSLDLNRVEGLSAVVVRRICLDRLRQRYREARALARLPAGEGVTPAPEEEVCSRLVTWSALEWASCVLTTAELRVVFLAAHGSGHSEIAAHLGVTQRASQVTLSRARNKLSREGPPTPWADG
jgi:RNA polymerase sigma factor (sigma-70 family)